jgi:hypothetical protein
MNTPFFRMRRTLAILGMVVSGSVLGPLITTVPALAAGPRAGTAAVSKEPAAAQPAALPAEDFGPQAAASSDVAVSGFGDSSGYHVQLGRESGGFAWTSLAVIKPQGAGASSWTGYQCLSGDGKYVAVAVLAADSVNLTAARDRGAFGYSIEVSTGKVTPVLSGIGLKYYSPGCGTADTAVFSLSLGAEEQTTGLVLVDLAAGKVTSSTTVAGQVSSAVPTADGILGVLGSTVVRAPDGGSDTNPSKPVELTRVKGTPFSLRPANDGGLDLLNVTPDNAHTQAVHFDGKQLTTLGQGPLDKVALFAGRDGKNTVTGLQGAPTAGSLKSIDSSHLSGTAANASLNGDAVFGSKNTPTPGTKSEQPAAPDRTNAASEAVATGTGKLLDRAFDTTVRSITTAVASFIPAGVTGQRTSPAERNTFTPKEKPATPAAPGKPAIKNSVLLNNGTHNQPGQQHRHPHLCHRPPGPGHAGYAALQRPSQLGRADG